jgi:hypothetical protein
MIKYTSEQSCFHDFALHSWQQEVILFVFVCLEYGGDMVIMKLLMKDEQYPIVYYRCYPVGRRKRKFGLGVNLIKHEVFSISSQEVNTSISNAVLRIYDVFERTRKIPTFTITK